jgi:hypothetical protein
MRCPDAYGKAFRIRKASLPRWRISDRRSSPALRVEQKTHAASGFPAVDT